MRSRSAASTTAPVGLFGEFRMTPRTRRPPWTRRSSADGSARQPSSSRVGAYTGSAPVSRTISGNETQYGEKSATASPSSKSAWQTLNTACFAPAVTITLPGATAAPCSRWYFASDGLAQRRLARDVRVLRPAGLDRVDPRAADEVRRREVRLPDREVHDVHARRGERLRLLPGGGRGRRRERGDPAGEARRLHAAPLQARAKAEKAVIFLRPVAKSPISSTIQAP